ncbi:hypothetical protein BB561_002058 [Smittium simulii]|uniref:Uncharacterized protein n=1 Tax=Smittium simulii TaxID=133385 RepID=A0A2T9YRV6_9FUNG|nr:hypothetical protein BB561_002058 [Smittium simulii]
MDQNYTNLSAPQTNTNSSSDSCQLPQSPQSPPNTDNLSTKRELLPQNDPSISWDLVTAYRLNTKLLRKYDRMLESLDRLLERNYLLDQQLKTLNRPQSSSLTSSEHTQNLEKNMIAKSSISRSSGNTFFPRFLLDQDSSRFNQEATNNNPTLSFDTNYKKKLKKSEKQKPLLRYFRDFNNELPQENIDTIKKKKFPSIITRARKWTEEDKANLAFGIRQQNKQILVNEILNSIENTAEEKKKKISKINKLKFRALEMNLEGLDWKIVSSLYVKTHKPSDCAIYWATQGHPIINKARWTSDEIKKLKQLVESQNGSDWVSIAISLNTNRNAVQCFKLYQRKINPQLTLSKWSPKEDELLSSLVKMYGEGNWQAIASCFYGRSAQQVLHRWYKSIDPDLKQGKWTHDEDRALLVGVKIFGVGKWNKIAEFVTGRTDVKCRERYVNVLSPKVKRGKWTSSENLRLISAVCKVGIGKWTTVSEMVGARSDNQCWRHWLSLNRRGLAPYPSQITEENDAVDANTPNQTLAEKNLDNSNCEPNNNLKAAESNSHVESFNISQNSSTYLFNKPESNASSSKKAVLKRNTTHRDLVAVDESISKKRRWKRINSNDDTSIERKIGESEIQEYVPNKIVQYFNQVENSTSKKKVNISAARHNSELFSSNQYCNKKNQSISSNPEDVLNQYDSEIYQSEYSALQISDKDVLQNQLLDQTQFQKTSWNEFFKLDSQTNLFEKSNTGVLFPPSLPILDTLKNIIQEYPEILDSFNKGFQLEFPKTNLNDQTNEPNSLMSNIDSDMESDSHFSNFDSNEKLIFDQLERLFLTSLIASVMKFD